MADTVDRPKRGRPVGSTKGTLRIVCKVPPDVAAYLREHGISRTVVDLVRQAQTRT